MILAFGVIFFAHFIFGVCARESPSKMKRMHPSSVHGDIVWGGRCVLCRVREPNTSPMFKCTESHDGRLCCTECMKMWIYAQTEELIGTARRAKCFNGCGHDMEMSDLQDMLTSEGYDAYCTALTRAYLNQDKCVVWCPCGTAFDTECGRTETPNWHQCQGCQNFVCLGCGEHSTEGDKRGRRKHKRGKTCKEIKFKNAQRCPKCTSQISRIEGCADMRCTLCNTLFDYETGEERNY